METKTKKYFFKSSNGYIPFESHRSQQKYISRERKGDTVI
jgi:hypothetical protein